MTFSGWVVCFADAGVTAEDQTRRPRKMSVKRFSPVSSATSEGQRGAFLSKSSRGFASFSHHVSGDSEKKDSINRLLLCLEVNSFWSVTGSLGFLGLLYGGPQGSNMNEFAKTG